MVDSPYLVQIGALHIYADSAYEQVSGSSPLIGSVKTAPIDAGEADFGAIFV